MKKNIIVDLSVEFALEIIEVYKLLAYNKKEFVMSKQMLRSGTAVGALIAEAQNAESKKDFIHKLAIAQKECGETEYWLYLLHKSNFIANSQYASLYDQCKSIMKILRSIIISTKQKLNNPIILAFCHLHFLLYKASLNNKTQKNIITNVPCKS